MFTLTRFRMQSIRWAFTELPISLFATIRICLYPDIHHNEVPLEILPFAAYQDLLTPAADMTAKNPNHVICSIMNLANWYAGILIQDQIAESNQLWN